MLLINYKDLANAIGGMDTVDNKSRYKSSIEQTTQILTSKLNMDFKRGVHTDYFYMSDNDPAKLGDHLILKTKTGCIDSGQLVTVKLNTVKGDLESSDETSEILIDYAKGCITLFDNIVNRTWAKVDYTAGYEEDDLGVAQNIPDWLKELTIALSGSIAAHYATLGLEFDRNSKKIENSIPPGIDEILKEYSRWKPTAFDAL